MMSTTTTAPQLTEEICDVMNIQGYLVEYFVTRGMEHDKAQDFAEEAVHQFMISSAVKTEYHEQYAKLESI